MGWLHIKFNLLPGASCIRWRRPSMLRHQRFCIRDPLISRSIKRNYRYFRTFGYRGNRIGCVTDVTAEGSYKYSYPPPPTRMGTNIPTLVRTFVRSNSSAQCAILSEYFRISHLSSAALFDLEDAMRSSHVLLLGGVPIVCRRTLL